MKKLFTLSLLLVSLVAFAVPARRIKKTITLADGTQKIVILKGDEYAHYYESNDGRLFDGDQETGFRELVRSEVEARHVQRMQQRNDERLARRTRAKAASRNSFVGTKKGLVLLVNFSDRKMSIGLQEWTNYFNKKGYNNSGMAGSVHDYFLDNSYGQFDLEFDVVGPLTVSKPMSYYGRNDSNGEDQHPGEMVREAVMLADKTGINFKDYDWDGDGYVDQVYVIYAGYGEASGAPTSTIWPHEYFLSAAAYYGDGEGVVKLDGVTIDTYACSNELFGTTGIKIDGIGTACHEFSHCLGFPDFYDTTGNSTINFGMSSWSIMDYGCYNNDGYCPCGYTSYERWESGWLTPTELTDPCFINNMPSLDASPTAYVIYNQGNKNEYYLLENRQKSGWNKYDLGHGMLILHVDYNKTNWQDNTVNNTSTRQRMTIIPADNDLHDDRATQLAGDPWPGTKNNVALTNTSTPAAKVYNTNSDGTKFMNKPIEDIKEVNGMISFKFDGGVPLGPVDPPTGLKVTDVTSTGFKASWDAVEGAKYYMLELTMAEDGDNVGDNEDNDSTDTPDNDNDNDDENSEEATLLLEESFEMFNKGTGDGSTDISGLLDDYTQTKGWKGMKLFTTSSNAVKVGSSTSRGYLTTPALNPKSGFTTTYFHIKPFGNDKTKLEILVNDESLETVEIDEDSYYYLELDNKAPYTITFRGKNNTMCRFYLSDIEIYDGLTEIDDDSDNDEFNWDDLDWDELLDEIFGVNGHHKIGKLTHSKADLSKAFGQRRIKTLRQLMLKGTSYTFTELTPGRKYGVAVYAAMPDERQSEYTNRVWVTLPSDNNSDSQDAIQSPIMSHEHKVYNLQGMEVKSRTINKGIYLIEGRKVVRL